MTPEAQRIAIAEACGWTKQEIEGLQFEGKPFGVDYRLGRPIPDYLSDLNAMHEAEKVAICHKPQLVMAYCDYLREKFGAIWHATSAQRAEAFLRTLNLWDDSK